MSRLDPRTTKKDIRLMSWCTRDEYRPEVDWHVWESCSPVIAVVPEYDLPFDWHLIDVYLKALPRRMLVTLWGRLSRRTCTRSHGVLLHFSGTLVVFLIISQCCTVRFTFQTLDTTPPHIPPFLHPNRRILQKLLISQEPKLVKLKYSIITNAISTPTHPST